MQNKHSHRKKILIIENDPLYQKVFQNLLGKAYGLIIVTHLDDATKSLMNDHPDMMIMDIHIDGFEGKSCLDYPDLYIPVLGTSSSTMMPEEGFRELGFSGFIKKPMNAKELFETLNRAFNNTPQQLTKASYLKVIDPSIVKDLKKYNSPDKLKEIYRQFISEANHQKNELQTVLEKDEPQKTVDILHVLKGNSGTLGISRIHSLSTRALESARKEDFQKVKDLIPEIDKEVQLLDNDLLDMNLF